MANSVGSGQYLLNRKPDKPNPSIDDRKECNEKYSRKRGEINVSASPWKTIPTTIMKATGCIPRIVVLPSSIFPDAMQRAEIGMMNIPNVIEVSAVFLRINWVTKFTVNTTTSGFTLAYQEGEAPLPAKRRLLLQKNQIAIRARNVIEAEK